MKKLNAVRIAYSVIVFVMLVSVMHIVPFNEGPDEAMRYQMPYYMYEHGRLPAGGDPEIRNEIWGLSYAYQPVNAYVLQALAMRIAAALGVADEYLYLSARFVNVLFTVGTVLICFTVGDLLFSGVFVWLFVMLVSLLPEFLFVSGYVNNDTYAVFCAALVILCLLKCREARWNIKSCVCLGIAVGLGVLSYYNVYGVLLTAALYCIAAVAIDKTIERRGRLILSRVVVVAAVSLALSGWWFIRNAVLYDGDFTGWRASNAESEKYALEDFKPSKHMTPKRQGYSLRYMLTGMGWVRSTCRSYVAVFSWMNMEAGQWMYTLSRAAAHMFASCWLADICRKIVKKTRSDKQRVLFFGAMLAMCALTLALSLIYSYMHDFQAQGRYLLPMLIPGALLCTEGLYLLCRRISEKLGKILAAAVMAFMACISTCCVYVVLLFNYAGSVRAMLEGFIG